MSINNKDFKIDSLIVKVNELKKNNIIIGFTNGCFDLLHNGHFFSFSESKNKCDYLIVGINSDTSIKLLKGNNRPIDNEYQRIKNISLRSEVDAIIVFHEKNPLDLIKKIKPNILFKGADYKDKEIVGSEFIISYGGKVELTDILNGYSTTNIIKNSSC